MTPHFFWGATTLACAVAGLFFLRFWSETRDRLFALFGAAFFLLGLNWLLLEILRPDRESRHLVYLVRLAAFSLILIAVLDKNRRQR